MRGGPPEWDGRATSVVRPKEERKTLERWDHTADLAIVYQRSLSEEEVEVARHTREGGTKIVTAEVWDYLGYRADLID